MKKIKLAIASQLSADNLELQGMDIYSLFEYPANHEHGDLSLPCFQLSKLYRKSPQVIANELQSKLKHHWIEEVRATGGYLNIVLDKEQLAQSVITEVLEQREQYGSQNLGEGKVVVLDYSSPNIAKPFHVAHLRSTVIGNALYQIYSFLGYRCIGVNHLGDWGTQFGKLMVAYRLWGDAERLEQAGIEELLRLYVKFHEESEQHPGLEEQARAWFVKLEAGNEEALGLWKWFVDISLKEFQRIYAMLGVEFDAYTGESFYNDQMSAVIEELKGKQLLEQDEGAWLVRLDSYEMPPALMLKSDGSSLYHTRDVTAALYRKRTYGFDQAIYVTDYAQSLHFKQWFKVIELMGYAWAEQLKHVAFGRVSIEGMGLATRKGNVIRLEEVLQQAIQKTREIIEARNPQLENKEEVAQQVGVGAIIFNDLSANRIMDIQFTWESALNFDGETGPYVQYTHARACSVLRKAVLEYGSSCDVEELSPAMLACLRDHGAFQQVVKELSLFPERIEQAMLKLEPSIISRYLIDLCQAFNRFYHQQHILVSDADQRTAYLALVRCVQITLRNGLRLIGLQAPEQI